MDSDIVTNRFIIPIKRWWLNRQLRQITIELTSAREQERELEAYQRDYPESNLVDAIIDSRDVQDDLVAITNALKALIAQLDVPHVNK